MLEFFHRTRRLYNFFSGILLVWEYVGFSLGQNIIEQAVINSQIAQIRIIIKHPEVAPIVLIFLVFYFSFRFTIEWYKLQEKNRSKNVYKIDFYSSHILGIVSILLYSFQNLFNFSLASFMNPQRYSFFLLGSSFPFIILEFIKRPVDRNKARKLIYKQFLIINSLIIVLEILFFVFSFIDISQFFSSFLGTIFTTFLMFILYRFILRIPIKKPEKI